MFQGYTVKTLQIPQGQIKHCNTSRTNTQIPLVNFLCSAVIFRLLQKCNTSSHLFRLQGHAKCSTGLIKVRNLINQSPETDQRSGVTTSGVHWSRVRPLQLEKNLIAQSDKLKFRNQVETKEITCRFPRVASSCLTLTSSLSFKRNKCLSVHFVPILTSWDMTLPRDIYFT